VFERKQTERDRLHNEQHHHTFSTRQHIGPGVLLPERFESILQWYFILKIIFHSTKLTSVTRQRRWL
jgi:hypothetical protein